MVGKARKCVPPSGYGNIMRFFPGANQNQASEEHREDLPVVSSPRKHAPANIASCSNDRQCYGTGMSAKEKTTQRNTTKTNNNPPTALPTAPSAKEKTTQRNTTETNNNPPTIVQSTATPGVVFTDEMQRIAVQNATRAADHQRRNEELNDALERVRAEGRLRLDETMNEEQRLAASAPVNRPLMIIAGAGTGKTTTMLQRIVYMVVECRIHPSSILFISFTNKAAKEAKERLAKLGLPGADRIDVGTFHSFCFGVLRYNFDLAGFQRMPTVISEKADLCRVVSAAMVRASVDQLREQVCSWLRLPVLETDWQGVVDEVQKMHPAGYRTAAEKAATWFLENSVAATKKKQRKKKSSPKKKTEKKEKELGVGRKRKARGNHGGGLGKIAGPAPKQTKLNFGIAASISIGGGGDAIGAGAAGSGGGDAIGAAGSGGGDAIGAAAAGSGGGDAIGAGTSISAGAAADVEASTLQQRRQKIDIAPNNGGNIEEEELAEDDVEIDPGALAAAAKVADMPRELQNAVFAHIFAFLQREHDPRSYTMRLAELETQAQKNRNKKKKKETVATSYLAKQPIKVIKSNLDELDSVKRRGTSVSQVDVPAFQRLYHLYQEELRAQNAVDFNDLLLYVRDIFKKYPHAARKLQNMRPHVMVDEFQDTNAVQMEICTALAPPDLFPRMGRSLTVVGDGDQSIYRFRGAEPHILHFFKSQYDGGNLRRRLELNYRCSAPVLDAAAAALIGNHGRDPEERLVCTKAGPADLITIAHLGAM